MSAEERQATLGGDISGDSLHLETRGRTIRPFLELPTAIVDEAKLRIGDTLDVDIVDPANVAMLRLTAFPGAFEEFQATDDMIVGMDLGAFADRVSDARMGKTTNDPVTIDLDATQTRVEIERGYGRTTVRRRDEWLNIDPDAIREEPDIPDLEMTTSSGPIDPRAFAAAIDDVLSTSDYCAFETVDGDLVLSGKAKNSDEVSEATTVTIPDAVHAGADDDRSLYSGDYLRDMAAALKKAKVDYVQLRWSEEFPAQIHFERYDEGSTLYGGTFMIAPRIQDGGDA